MSLIRRNPYDPFYDINQTMDRMVNHMRSVMNAALIPFEDDVLVNGHNPLSIDMSSDDHTITVRTSLPGFSQEDVNIDVQGKVLTISAETKSEHQNEQANWHLREIRHGKFARAITLPEEIVADNAEASLENGILTVTLPKQKPSIVQKIAVKAQQLLSGGNKKDS